MVVDFDNFGHLDLPSTYPYTQDCTLLPTGGPSGVPCVETTTLGQTVVDGAVSRDLPSGLYLGYARTDRSGFAGAHTNMSLADPDGWPLFEVWSGDWIIRLKVAGTTLTCIVNDPDDTASSGITAFTSAAAFTVGTYQWIELGWTVSTIGTDNRINADGSVTLRVGQTVIATATELKIGYHLPLGYTRDVLWNVTIINPHGKADMIYLLDGSGTRNTTFLSTGIEMQTILPSTGNGTYTELTASTGTDQGALVNDSLTTTYVSSLDSAKKSSFNFPNFTAIPNGKAIVALKHVAGGQKMESGYRRFRSFLRRGGIDKFAATDYPIGVGNYSWMSHVYEVDPFTNRTMTLDLVNASEFGVSIG